jgi:transposase
MPRAYSSDLRERVLAACDAREGTRGEIARRFRVSESTLYLWGQQRRQEGRTCAKPHHGGTPSRFDVGVLEVLIAQRRERTLAELGVLYAQRTGQAISKSSVDRLLRAHGIGRKKNDLARRRATASRRRPRPRAL